ncbi:MAG: hypothetical protein RR954_08070 [Christensenellaceae bacterium]
MNEQNNTTNEEKPSKKGITLKPWQLIVTILVIVTLIGGGIFAGVNWNNWFGEKAPVADIDTGAHDWNNNLPNDDKNSTANKGEGIAIPGYPSITIPKDTKDVQVMLLNPKGNLCYFTFEIVIKDTNETIYTSKQVPPGKAVTNLTLTKPLSAGTYKATIKITTNSLKDMSPMNGANVETELIVK